MVRERKLFIVFLIFILWQCYLLFTLPTVVFGPLISTHGFGIRWLGFLMAAFCFFFAIGSLTMGLCLPSLGVRFSVVSSTCLAGTSSCLLGFLSFTSPGNHAFGYVLIFLRSLSGFSAGLTAVAITAFLPLYFSTTSVRNTLGAVAFTASFGVTVGPAIGATGLMIHSFSTPFLIVGCLLLLESSFLFFLLGEDEIACPDMNHFLKLTLKSPTVLAGCLHIIAFMAPMGLVQSVVQPHLKSRLNLAPTDVGLFLLATTPITIFTPLTVSFYVPGGLLWFGFVILSFSLFSMGPSFGWTDSTPVFFFIVTSLIFLGASFSSTVSSGLQVLAKEVKRTLRSNDELILTNAGTTVLFKISAGFGMTIGAASAGLAVAHSGTKEVITGWGYFSIAYIIFITVYLLMRMFWRKSDTVYVTPSLTNRVRHHCFYVNEEERPLLGGIQE